MSARIGAVTAGMVLVAWIAAGSDALAQSTPPWWDSAYAYRSPVTVTTGATPVSPGYNGYTARVIVDSVALAGAGKILTSADDLRMVWWSGNAWTELPRHLVGGGSSLQVRFMLQADIPVSGSDTGYYLYYGNPAAGTPSPMDTTNVYLWYDDALVDRLADYTHGQIDDTSFGPECSCLSSWDSVGFAYVFNTGAPRSESFRPTAVSERDVYVEYEFVHTQAFPQDMTIGPIVRWSGTGGEQTEVSDDFYYYELAHSGDQNNPFASHDSITHADRENTVVPNGTLGAIPVSNTFRRVALAAWSTGPTNLRAWYDAAPAAAGLGGFGAAPRFFGTHGAASETQTAGQAGFWHGQQGGAVRNILIRRYVDPEPTTTVGAEEWVGSPPPGPVPAPSGLSEGEEGCGCGTVRVGWTAPILWAVLLAAAVALSFRVRNRRAGLLRR